MKFFGFDLGGSTIKVCRWNPDQTSSTGVGAEIVENDSSQRASEFAHFEVMDRALISFKDLQYNICNQHKTNVEMYVRNE